ncbi:hypothetical protein [Geobacter sp. DSM 9736]|uniref:hypothetical protein n=1 Tax=Geobacter sp. DSM 9736 TaxID=1277350 RepID=UPI000B50174B|nr:hypothetical protein [Geobacter sp. DSM 9736]SNB46763.1 hypothetical protein SAMN06269301_2233 [Geobacter sp. DSM 9736]
MELKTKIWMTGDLEWYAYIGEEEMFLGKREVPIPLEEGDRWVNEFGDVFQIIDATIVHVGRTEVPEKHW